LISSKSCKFLVADGGGMQTVGSGLAAPLLLREARLGDVHSGRNEGGSLAM